VEVSDSQKQSINDAFQYVVVHPYLSEDIGMDVAKIRINTEIYLVFLKKDY